jgi:hypothetical protein
MEQPQRLVAVAADEVELREVVLQESRYRAVSVYVQLRGRSGAWRGRTA